MITGNYYEILQVEQNSNPTEIKRGYVRMIRKYSNENHPEEFKVIAKAYNTLMDAESRKSYDHSIQDNGMYQQQIDHINRLVNQELYQAALDAADDYLGQYPRDRTILYLKALCHSNLDQYLEAEKILKRLIVEHPNEEQYISELASLYTFHKHYGKAIRHFEKLIELDPLENNYYLRLSNCFFNLEQHQKAADVLEKKLRKSRETVYDFPLLSELYFLSIVMEDDAYHERIVSRIKALPKNSDENSKLINMMIDLAVSLETDHYLFRELVYIIDDLNDGDQDVSEWVEAAEDRLDPNRNYYGDDTPVSGNYNPAPVHQRETAAAAYAESDKGSVFWSVIIGIILSIAATPFVGIIAGFVYYFKARQIKKILSGVGCFILGIVILGFIIQSCGL
ncbi:DnaJ domain-containing protein [Mesobacillus harenae]|uniref:DnaJ domain-containing protein n=1 Tax=Mesobacillus harenae TaxID=2213203 RepID=UPI001580039B